MRTPLPICGFFLLAALGPHTSHAVSARELDVPPALAPWVDWALHDAPDAFCPRDPAGQALCSFPTALALDLYDRAGRFSGTTRVVHADYVPLPGDEKSWPFDVKLDNQPAPVVMHDGHPAVQAKPGIHQISGTFQWSQLPESLAIPPHTALLTLKVRGDERNITAREDPGRVWLAKPAETPSTQDRIEIRVHRKFVDDVPLLMETQLLIDVSGVAREENLGEVLPVGFVPYALEGGIPARFEPDQTLRVQVRPGSWTLSFWSRQINLDVKTEIAAPHRAPGSLLPDEEIWVFEARPSLRGVRVEGLSAIDPSQTRLSPDWRRLPSYRVIAGNAMRLVELRRGDSDPGPDELRLRRELWLDFDGQGLTLKDRIVGTLRQSQRLEMNAPVKLGRIAVQGDDQFITQLSDRAQEGVELRSKSVQIQADSRIEGAVRQIPVGWAHDFSSASMFLHLPPGWHLLTAMGVDDVNTSWLERWTLLDLFLVLIITLSFGRLYGVSWGFVSLLTLVLIAVEPDAPRWSLLVILALEALWRVLPEGRILRLTRVLRATAILVALFVSLPFAVQQVRQGLYPALEKRFGGDMRSWPTDPIDFDVMPTAGNAMPESPLEEMEFGEADAVRQSVESKLDGLSRGNKRETRNRKARAKGGMDYASSKQNLKGYDFNTKVQTGPGLPSWRFKQVELSFSGPIQATQQIELVLISPPMALALNFARVLLLTLLLLCLLDRSSPHWPGFLRKKRHVPGVGVLALLVVTGGSFSADAQAAGDTFPTPELLSELQRRLTAPPSCAPNCVSAGRMELSVQDNRLRVLLEVDAAADDLVMLPGSASQWLPSTILIDQKPAEALYLSDAGSVGAFVMQGRHRVVLQGPLPRRENIQLALPLRPHHTVVDVDGFSVDGVHPDGSADNNLQINRLQSKDTPATELEAAPLPAFARIDRVFELGLDWTSETTISRLSPLGVALVMELPLLPDEKVISDQVRVEDGKVLVQLMPTDTSVSWRSTLSQRQELTLTAPKYVPYTERWRILTSPIWHVQRSGIPPVHEEEEEGLLFAPRVGEQLTLRIDRPQGIDGQTFTIDSSLQEVKPGTRATDVELTLQIRSSRGDTHALVLPEGAELASVLIDGKNTPLRVESQKVMLPLLPGKQNVKLHWREPRGMTTRFSTSTIELGAQSVNPEIKLVMPEDRWLLFAYGPRLGPAVLFWSLFVMIGLVAFGLSRVKLTPLGFSSWFLLGVGMTQVDLILTGLVVGWLLMLGYRKQNPDLSPGWFNLRQLLLIGWTCIAFAVLFVAIQEGLLGAPDMQVTGNGSRSSLLHWTHDRSAGQLPTGHVISVPLLVYRGLMLAWALWLAFALIRWLRFGWDAFSTGGFFLSFPKKPRPSPRVHVTPPPGAPSSAAPFSATTAQPPAPTVARPASDPPGVTADAPTPATDEPGPPAEAGEPGSSSSA